MPDAAGSSRTAPNRDLPRPGSLASLPRRTYRFRVLGMGLALLPLATVMRELDAHVLVWTWIVFGGLVWPHVAYAMAVRSADPFRAELRNFVIDSFMAGSWAPLMHFNALPSAVLITVVTADKVNSGVRNLWLRSLPWMAVAICVGAILTGFAWQPVTSMPVLLACLPILMIHTIAVSLSSYRLVRRVQRQNLQLEALSRTDALTGLDSRRHWEAEAAELLRSSTQATLLLVDIDRFKQINDVFGHTAGDDVLCDIAQLIRRTMPTPHHAGRLGGDEFVIALPLDLVSARHHAEALRDAVRSVRSAGQEAFDCTVSIGLAPAPSDAGGLRAWLEAADRALYRAKREGRDRTATPPA